MYISKENQTQTEERLMKVLGSSSLKIYDNPYCFEEFTSNNHQSIEACLAMIKDDEVWSYLVPAKSNKTENFKVFSFHFEDGLDNSGFVGWLAMKIKDEFGSGVFVVCGQNSKKGGIFDYWGCPIELADQVETFLEDLQSK